MFIAARNRITSSSIPALSNVHPVAPIHIPFTLRWRPTLLNVASRRYSSSVKIIDSQPKKYNNSYPTSSSKLSNPYLKSNEQSFNSSLSPSQTSSQLSQQKLLTTMTDLFEDVEYEFKNGPKVAGVQSEEFPTFNEILKGHRKGELTVLTGPTGSGKTTFLSQLSLDFAMQGVKTLWGSFEISNVRLLKKMVCQYGQHDFMRHYDEPYFKECANELNQLPLYFMPFHGSTTIDLVLSTLRAAHESHSIEHVIVDNLQFMLSNQSRGIERWDHQEIVLHELRSFATKYNTHVTIVVHPKKEPEDSILNMSSIMGSAKVTQEADNVLIMQRLKDKQWLEVRKNRFDGQRGFIYLEFHRDKGSIYTEKPIGKVAQKGGSTMTETQDDLENKQMSIKQITVN